MMANQINITTQDGNSVVVNTTDTNIIEIISAGPQGPKGDSGSSINIDTGSFATTGSNIFNGNQTITGSVDITGSLTVNTINVGLNTINFIDENRNIINSLAIPSGSANITILTGSIQSVGEAYFSGSFTGSLFGTASLAFDIINKPFLSNQTSDTNIIRANENIFNHGDLLIHSENTLIIEDGAEYFILGNLINSGSIIVSGSLIVHGIIYNVGSIVGPGTVLSNNVLVTYDKANIAYGFLQLDNTGNIANTISLLGTASFALTASYIDPNFISASVVAAGFGSGSNNNVNINTGSFATTGSNIFNGNQTVTGSINVTSGGITGSLYNEAFSKNKTTSDSINIIKQYQSIFNPSNLFIGENDIFIVEQNAEYYVLGDLINSGSIIVNGTLKMNGVLHNNGSITGIGIIE